MSDSRPFESESTAGAAATPETSQITRRDFVNSALLGTGAALLASASPLAMRAAQAQTTGLKMTGLGPDWTGPGEIGDYARSNGNTWEVVNAAHGYIRNLELEKRVAAAPETGETCDAVVVGCGIAGLSAGWTYSKARPGARVLLLDQHAIFGGEAKQNEFEVDGYHLTFTSPLNWNALDRPNQPVRMRLGATVIAVQHEGEPGSAREVLVTYFKDGKLRKVRAKAAILCGQQHANRHICTDISPEVRGAMDTFHHAPMLTVNVAVRNWKFLENLGIASARWFEGFGWWMSLRRNLEIPGQVTQPLDPAKPFVFSLYNSFPLPGVPFPQQCTAARMQLFAMPFAHIEAGVRSQFTKMFGDYGFDANRDIAGIVANRWGHAYVVDPPGFFFGRDGKPAPRDIQRKGFHRLVFGHSELSGSQMWETAADEGRRAARQVLEAA